MILTILSLIYALAGLFVLIFIHELGHFVFAKLNGIRVEVFSLGYGRAVASFTRGGTKYQIGAFPLGGFCKMAGEELKEGYTGASDEFYAKNPFQRLTVVLAGPLFNYIAGILIFSSLFLFPSTFQTAGNKIEVARTMEITDRVKIQTNGKERWKSGSMEIESPAYLAGLKTGDQIIAVDEKKTETWDDIRKGLRKDFTREKSITILRDDEKINFSVSPVLDRDTGMPLVGIMTWTEPVIRGFPEGSALPEQGIYSNDRIVSMNGIKFDTASEMMALITESPFRVLTLLVEREGILIKKQVPVQIVDDQRTIQAYFGPEVITATRPAYGLFKALEKGFIQANETIGQNIKALGHLFRGRLNARKSMGGPVKIIAFATGIAKHGFIPFLSFMGVLSVLLAFFNLLPIPPIDGSFVLVFLFEGISRRKLNMKLVEAIQTVGFVVLITLVGLITLNDILSLIGIG